MRIACGDDLESEVLARDVSNACELDPNVWHALSLLRHFQLPNKPVGKVEFSGRNKIRDVASSPPL
jgi:hypothetical protein